MAAGCAQSRGFTRVLCPKWKMYFILDVVGQQEQQASQVKTLKWEALLQNSESISS